MSDDRSVTDEEILSGFTSLQDAVLAGFAAMQAQFAMMGERFERRFVGLEETCRIEIAAFEHRMLRRFDALEERVGRVESRLEALERRFDAFERRFENR